MKISLNDIRYYRELYNWSDDPAPQGVDELVRRIGAQLAAVEEVIPVGERYKDARVVKVISCDDHPNADRLHVCKVDDDGQTQDIERDENGLVQVVCGAPNVYAGMLAVWLPPGSTVPSTYAKDPFVLEARALRGVISNGMLASPKELGIGDSHEGILELKESDTAHPGILFAEAVHLKDDVVIDMENKMFTHRPDLFGTIGIAREIAGIYGQKFTSPDWYRHTVVIDGPHEGTLPLEVRNELPELVPRFVAVPLENITIGDSPAWLQVSLARLGVRPINNVVDITNYYMLLTGQPTHAYDYDKVRQASGKDQAVLTIRHPHQGEKLTLLNGKEISPREQAIMIATDQRLIGVGGVMGGADTEVDANTKRIIIECATFDMYSIRRTSMAHGIFSDAVTRFNKGQSPLQNTAVLSRIIAEIQKLAGGVVAGPVVDDNHVPHDVRERGSLHNPVVVSAPFINERLGLSLSSAEITKLLANVEFQVQAAGDELTVTAPFWRTDIAIPEDIVEEVGRLYGYDKLPLDLPLRTIAPVARNPLLTIKTKIRNLLASAGANEVLTYNFVHGNLIDRAGQQRTQAFELSNALSPDLQYLRLSLTPSLLEKVHPNTKAGYDCFALFELGKAHNKTTYDAAGLPREAQSLAYIFAANSKAQANFSGAPYYQARKYLTELLVGCNAYDIVSLVPLKDVDVQADSWFAQMAAPYDPNRSAVLRDASGQMWGVVGEFRSSVRKGFKLPLFSSGFEFDPALLLPGDSHNAYMRLPRFPKVEQDICLRVPAATPYQEVFNFVWNHLDQNRPDATYHSLGPVDIYQRADEAEHKQITLRLSIASFERTLTDDEVQTLLDAVAEAAKNSLNAQRI